MATLDICRKKNIRRRNWISAVCLFLSGSMALPWISGYLIQCLECKFVGISEIRLGYIAAIRMLLENKEQRTLCFCGEACIVMVIVLFLTRLSHDKPTKTVKIAEGIEIPASVGEGQHGTSRFMTEEEKGRYFAHCYYQGTAKLPEQNYGLVLGMEKSKGKEDISCITEDIHSIIIGATRSGKTRGLILQSIWLRAYSGGSMVISDPKGELYLYSKEYLEEREYQVIDFDLRQAAKSKHYNYLDIVCQAVKEKDIPKAIDATWDIVSTLVGVPKGEPLWSNGEGAVIAAAILAVVLEAPPEYHNLANVYYFVAYMCREDLMGEMPINRYFEQLPDSHPAKAVFATALIAPDKMRGSFFGSALVTLRLFSNWNIADLTSCSDFDPKELGTKKTALFIIIPDEKTTLYGLVSLMVNQTYVQLVDLANSRGGRLDKTVDFFLDEFGNFPAIPSFGSMLSVGAGRGMRFSLVLQDYQQLEKNYEKDSENIKGNCQLTVYLKSPTYKTLEELSKRTGNYTIQVKNVSNSISETDKWLIPGKESYSDSASMASRALLTADEIGRIERPYSLVLYSGKYPAVFTTPDLSKYYANREMGLGDPKHNKEILIIRDNVRAKREVKEIQLWGIWNKMDELEMEEEESKGTTFFDL